MFQKFFKMKYLIGNNEAKFFTSCLEQICTEDELKDPIIKEGHDNIFDTLILSKEKFLSKTLKEIKKNKDKLKFKIYNTFKSPFNFFINIYNWKIF